MQLIQFSKQRQASKQQASTLEMGKNQILVALVWSWLKFCYMMPMGVKYNHTKWEQETEAGVASGGPLFQFCQASPKMLVWGSRMFVVGAICIGANLDYQQTPWGTIQWLFARNLRAQ